MFVKNQLEDECYTCGETVALEGDVVAFVTVEHTKVVTYINAEFIHDFCTYTTAEHDVETAVVATLVVVGRVDTSGMTCNGNRRFSGRCDTYVGSRAGISKQLEGRSEVETDAHLQRNIYIVLLSLGLTGYKPDRTGAGRIEVFIVDTRIEGEADCAALGGKISGVTETGIEAVGC